MKCSKYVLYLIMGGLASGPALAAPTPEEAKQLGTTLTPFGAIKAGNADGTIPAWDGGLCKPPPGYKPIMGAQGGSPYVDPFANEKPSFSITAKNLSQYADKVDTGTKALFERYPDTFRIDVYPTHRTACFLPWVYDNTIKRVMEPKTVEDGTGLTGAHAQVPFPIPKTGYEAMWNSNTKFEPADSKNQQASFLVDSNGGITVTSVMTVENRNSYWDNTITSVPEDESYWKLISNVTAPSSQNGNKQMQFEFLRADENDSKAWQYVPGQRRVRLAPEFKYDTVSTTSGGVLLFDEINGFDGKMDKFDFKLKGRKEMYVPYNNYKFWTADSKVKLTKNHVNPDYFRWELHRVWEIEATLKPDERHVEKSKTFYLDEDSWSITIYYGLDQSDKVYHLMYQGGIQMYEIPAYRNGNYVLYDFNKGVYADGSDMGAPGMRGVYTVEPFPANYFTSGVLGGSGIR